MGVWTAFTVLALAASARGSAAVQQRDGTAPGHARDPADAGAEISALRARVVELEVLLEGARADADRASARFAPREGADGAALAPNGARRGRPENSVAKWVVDVWSRRARRRASRGARGAAGRRLDSDADDPDVTEFKLTTSTYLILTFLVMVTVSFELMKDYILNHTEEQFKKIVNTLFSEMTVLGFLSVVTFLLSEAALLDDISTAVYGEEGSDYLEGLVEDIHYSLFAVMVCFLVQAICILYSCRSLESMWQNWNRQCQDGQLMLHLHADLRRFHEPAVSLHERVLRLCDYLRPPHRPFKVDGKWETKEDMLMRFRYAAMRLEFIRDRSKLRDSLPPFKRKCEIEPEGAPEYSKAVQNDFDYAAYLTIQLVDTFAEVVEVPAHAWLVLMVFITIFYGIQIAINNYNVGLAWVWVGAAYLVLLGQHVLLQKLYHIQSAIMDPEIVPTDGTTEMKRALLDNDALHGMTSYPEWTEERYNVKPRPACGCFGACVYSIFGEAEEEGEIENWHPQHNLYWAGEMGPEFHVFLVRLLLLCFALYTVELVLEFSYTVYANMGLAMFVVYIVLALIPLPIFAMRTYTLMPTLAHVSCVGCFRNKLVVNKVERDQKTQRALKALNVLYNMQAFTDEGGKDDDADSQSLEMDIRRLDRAQEEQVRLIFHKFDNENPDERDGTIDTDELANLLKKMHFNIDPKRLYAIAHALDKDGDGQIAEDEFVAWYARTMCPDPRRGATKKATVDINVLVERMFAMIDEDGSGDVGAREFVETLKIISDVGVDDVADLVRELDTDGDGQISKEEFKALLIKHSQFLDADFRN